MTETLREIASKLWSLGKLVIPNVAIFTLLKELWDRWLSDILGGWLGGIVDDFKIQITARLAEMGVDLTPTGEFAAIVAKINFVIPLAEMWFYLLLYLGLVATLIVIKWVRNLIPGVS